MNKAISYYFDIIYGKRRGLFSFFLRVILFLLSILYSLSFKIRDFFYSSGLFKTNKLPVPVISVGNITLGGTGKTPFIIWLAEYLKKEKYKIGILSRGYGRRNKNKTVILSNNDEILDYNISGDEPLLIKNHIDAEIPVIIGSNRTETGSLLCSKFDTKIILLDDGFQHISLKRDLNIVVIDALNPFGNHKVFPAGILRENINNLKRAEIFLITKVDLVSLNEKNKVRELINNVVDNAVIIEGIFQADKFVSLKTKKEYSLEYISKNRCIAFSGIGDPESFMRTLTNINIPILEHIIYSDHYPYSEKEINEIFKRKLLLNSDIIITTEKDAIRLHNIKIPPTRITMSKSGKNLAISHPDKIGTLNSSLEEDILYLSIKLKVVTGEEFLEERIKKILT